MNTLKRYWACYRSELTATLITMTVCILMVGVGLVSKNRDAWIVAVGFFCGLFAQVGMNLICYWHRQRAALGISATLVLALFAAPFKTAGAEPPTQELPGYAFNYTTSINLMLPDGGPPQDRIAIIPAAVCFGILVGAVGYVAVKIISACVKEHEFIVTNNAACAACPAESPIQTGVPVPVVTGSGQTPDCNSCAAPPPAAGQPLPVEIQHSFDRDHWVTVSHGISVGQELSLPDVGYWRAVPLSLRMERVENGGLILHAPPGVLEHSTDLRNWDVVSVNTADTDLVADAGFYRVRVN